jgi:Protein of unknown function (DUF3455)
MTQRCTVVLIAGALLGLLGACATADRVSLPAVPESLRVSASQVAFVRARGVGVQIYECRSSPEEPAHLAWILKAPDAQLADRAGKTIIRHFAGPTWQATDGSAVVGEVVARDNAPDPDAIPWLLLRAKSTSGSGLLSRTLSIQRLQTVGGNAPAAGCSAAQAGSEVRVDYSADYLFYKAR